MRANDLTPSRKRRQPSQRPSQKKSSQVLPFINERQESCDIPQVSPNKVELKVIFMYWLFCNGLLASMY
jgi:hypothetical protein